MVIERFAGLWWDKCAQSQLVQLLDLITDIVTFEADVMKPAPALYGFNERLILLKGLDQLYRQAIRFARGTQL